MIKKLKDRIDAIQLEIDAYEAGKIALTSKQLDKLFKDKHQAIADLKQKCTHEKCYINRYVSTDSGYGCDRDYYYRNVKCEECDTDLGDIGGGNEGYGKIGRLTNSVPLIKLVEANETLFSKEWLAKHGINRQEHITRTYSYSKTGDWLKGAFT